MLKIFIIVILNLLLTVILGIFFPWWTVAIPFLSLGVLFPPIPKKYLIVFCIGFGAIFLLWFGISLFIDLRNESILSRKIIQLFSLGAGWHWLLAVASGFIGGLLAGISSCIGLYIKSNFFTPNHKWQHYTTSTTEEF